jgi:hypothetical protein
MSQPEIQEQIRAARISASPELRARVAAIAATPAAAPPARPRRELPWRRWAFVAVPAAAAVALAATLTVGLATSGKNGGPVHRDAASPPIPATGGTVQQPFDTQAATGAPAPQKGAASSGTGGSNSADLPSTPGRAQLYDAELALKVSDLSGTTKRALRLTRTFHGYVRSIEYGSGSERGSAYMVVRVPVGSVQEALVRFSALGTIVDQHVSIQDVQPTVDRRFRQMQGFRDSIAKLQARLESPKLTADQRTALENQLVTVRRQLVLLQKQQSALLRQTSYATVELDLRTKAKAAVVPHEPSRLGRALHRSGQFLVDEVKVILYVLIVGAPVFLLLALAFGGFRVRRRRDEARLLATS